MHGLSPCTYCSRLFESEQWLADHIRRQHTCEKSICTECSANFSNQIDLQVHITSEHLKILCDLCGSLTLIDEHQLHLSTLNKITDNSIKIIRNPVNRNEFRCSLCHDKKSINRLDKLLLHYLYLHKCSLLSLLQFILNDNDMKSLQSQNCDDIHAKCLKCYQKYTTLVPKIFHKIYCHGSIYCATCINCFDTQENYDKHLMLCGSKLSKITFCDNCNSLSTDELHFSSVHKISTASWSQITSLLNANNNCNFCMANFSSEIENLNEIQCC